MRPFPLRVVLFVLVTIIGAISPERLLFPAGTAVAFQDFTSEIASSTWEILSPITNEIAKSATIQIQEVCPTPFFVNDHGGLYQLVVLRMNNDLRRKAMGLIEASGSGKVAIFEEIELGPGPNDVIFHLPDLREPGSIEIVLTREGQFQQRLLFDWKPAKQWKVYVVQTSHFDHGYTGRQDKVMAKQDKILDDVLTFCSITDDWPEEARFRWFVEASYCLSHYLQTHPWREEEISKRIAEGRIEVGTDLVHLHSSTAGHEELVRNLLNSTMRLADRFDANVITAAHNDVDGITWGMVAAWAGAGIRYFSFNPNNFYRGGNILHETETPQAYYWVGPGGQKVLTWRSRLSYNEAGFLLEGMLATIISLPQMLQGYEDEGYPYDAIHLTRTGLDRVGLIDFTDNASPHLEVCDTIRRWNENFEYPKLLCATSSQFFRYLDENYKNTIPEFSGDCPDWWADGVLTGALAEGKVRRLHHQLYEAEVLSSAASILTNDYVYPGTSLDLAWEQTLLFDEHTWGSMFPFLPVHDEIWQAKVESMEEAVETVHHITKEAVRTITEKVKGDEWRLFVFNAMSWDRDDIAVWQAPHGFPPEPLGADFFTMENEDGEQVPYQITTSSSDGTIEVTFLAKDVPSVGYRTYRIVPSAVEPLFENNLVVDESSLGNEYYRIAFDPAVGVTSLRDLELERELIDSRAPYRLNEFVSRQQGLFDLQDSRRRGRIVAYRAKETGPVYASVVFEISDPDRLVSTITQEIRLYDGVRRVDFIDSLDNFDNQLGQSKYFVFPFDVPDFEFHLDIPLAVMRPFYEQLPDFAKYYAIQHWVELSSPGEDFGVTWATAEGPMVELGEITKKSSWFRSLLGQDYYDPGEYPYEPRSPHVYSEIMNNFQSTNFNFSQSGSGTWRYWVSSHKGSWDQPMVTRFGWGLASPLVVEFFKTNPEGILPQALSFFRVRQPNVKIVAVKAAEDGDGYIVRLFENEGRPTQVELEIPLLKEVQASLVDLAERQKSPLLSITNIVIVNIGAFDLATIQIKGESAFLSDEGKLNGRIGEGGGGCACNISGSNPAYTVPGLMEWLALFAVILFYVRLGRGI